MKLQKKVTCLFSLFIALFSLFYLPSYTTSSAAEVDDAASFGTPTPVINELQQIASSDGIGGDQFGFSAAIDGDTAVIGALKGNGTTGSAYVFVRNGDVWTEQAKLTASDAAINDNFGHSVAIHGNTIVVGAPLVLSNAGAAYVFVRNGTSWTEEAKLSQGNVVSELIGISIAIWGDTVIVGAPNTGTGIFRDVGRAYIYKRTGNTWNLEQQIVASDGSIGNSFGSSIGIEGNTAVIGAQGARGVTGAEGAVYVFSRSGTVWSEQTRINANDSARFKNFAYSLSFSGNTIAVGAYSDTEMSINSGSVYIFTGNGASWSQQAKLLASDRASLDNFGWSVSLKGNILAVGARSADSPEPNSGAGYIFKRTGTVWTEEQKLVALRKNVSGFDAMGFSIAHNGRYIFSGTPGTQDIVGNVLGSANIFDLLSETSCQPVQPDLVSWWTGDGNTLDVRSRNDGILQNGASYGTGKVGQGVDFNGVSEHISVPHNTNLNIQNSFSAEAWIFPRSALNSNNYFLSKSATFGNRWLLNVENNVGLGSTNTINVNINDTVGGSAPSQSINLNQWNHVAFTYDNSSGTLKLYINAIEVLTDTDMPQTVTNTDSVTIGNNLAGRDFDGLVDEVLIYNRVISQSEIQASFNANGLGKCKPTAAVKPSGLVGRWSGDGDAKDWENGADGTLLNGTGFIVGKVGQSFSFNNMNQFIEASDTNLPMGANARTTEMWIKPNNNARVTAIYGAQTAISAFYPIVIGGNICIGRFGGGDQCGTTNIIDGNWHHIAITYDGASTTTLYLDGQVERIVSRSYNTTSNGGLLRIGNTFSGSSDSFDGDMDEISIYNRALTLTEIKSIFDADLAGKLKSVNTNVTPFSEFAEKFSKSKGQTNVGSSVVSKVGDATITFNNVTANGTTQQIPFDINNMPALPSGIITGLQYDIATSATYTGDVDICFNLPAFTLATDFAGLRVLHLENNVWENRTTTSDFATKTLCSSVTSLSPFAIIKFAPTAANVKISGKVLNSSGRGIPRAVISVTDQNGNSRTVNSNHFGYYSFENISAGEVYTFVINSKQYQFAPQVVNVSESISNLNFTSN